MEEFNNNSYVFDIDSFQKDYVILRYDDCEIYIAKFKENNQKFLIHTRKKSLNTDDYLKNRFYIMKKLSKASISGLLPIYGILNSENHATIYEYSNYKSLCLTLHCEPCPITLSNTQKMKIIICILQSLIKLHKIGIIHQNIRTESILLDTNLLPKLIDCCENLFPEANDSQEDNFIGSPTWIAPEVFKTHKYTEKSDIYSFGIFLFEILADQKPYSGYSYKYIQDLALKGSLKVPKSDFISQDFLRIIEKCCDINPENRPSANDIYNDIISNKIYIAGINEDEFTNFTKKLQENTNQMPSLRNIRSIDEDKPVMNRFHNIFLENEINFETKIDFSGFSIDISDPYNKSFVRSIQILFASTNENNFENNFTKIKELMKKKIPRETTTLILSEISSFLKRFPHFCENFCEICFNFIPFYDISFSSLTLSILLSVVKQVPQFFTQNIALTIMNHFYKFPKEILSIFSFYSYSFYFIDDPYPVLDVFINNAKQIISVTEITEKYIRILFDLHSKFPNFRRKRGEFCFQIYISLLFVCDVRTVRHSLSCLSIFNKVFLQDVVINLLENPLTRKNSLNLLLVFSEKLEFNQLLFDSLIENIKYETSVLILCKLIEKGDFKFIVSNTSWLLNTKQTTENVYKLFLLLFSHQNSREIILKSQDFVPFLNRLCTTNNNEILYQISVLLLKFLNEEIIDKIRFHHFVDRFVSLTSKCNEERIILSCLHFICCLEEYSIGNEFYCICPNFKVWLSNENSSVRMQTMKIALIFMKNQKYKDLLNNYKILDLLRGIHTDDESEKKCIIQILSLFE